MRRLIGDIGATNARFAWADADGRTDRIRVLACDDYPTIEDALAAYLADDDRPEVPREVALAVASPITGNAVAFTNHPWSFTISGLKRRFALERLLVVNDFTANALAMPRLSPSERIAIGGGAPVAEAAIGVLGPGSGLGVSGLVWTPGGWVPLSGEGGHATMAACDARETAVLERMRKRFDHVSAERHLGEAEPIARAALAMFCAMLGSFAGNLALTLGARGGIYIAGGIVPRLVPSVLDSGFRARFEAKGRFQPYLAAIPTYVVAHPIPAFLGLITLLDQGNK